MLIVNFQNSEKIMFFEMSLRGCFPLSHGLLYESTAGCTYRRKGDLLANTTYTLPHFSGACASLEMCLFVLHAPLWNDRNIYDLNYPTGASLSIDLGLSWCRPKPRNE